MRDFGCRAPKLRQVWTSLRPKRQPAKLHGIHSRVPPGRDFHNEAGRGDFRGAKNQAAAVPLVEVKAGEAEMNHRRRIERSREVDGEAEDAGVFDAVGERFGEVPSLGERSELKRGGQAFPGLHWAIHGWVFFSGPAAGGKARFGGKGAGSRHGGKRA